MYVCICGMHFHGATISLNYKESFDKLHLLIFLHWVMCVNFHTRFQAQLCSW